MLRLFDVHRHSIGNVNYCDVMQRLKCCWFWMSPCIQYQVSDRLGILKKGLQKRLEAYAHNDGSSCLSKYLFWFSMLSVCAQVLEQQTACQVNGHHHSLQVLYLIFETLAGDIVFEQMVQYIIWCSLSGISLLTSFFLPSPTTLTPPPTFSLPISSFCFQPYYLCPLVFFFALLLLQGAVVVIFFRLFSHCLSISTRFCLLFGVVILLTNLKLVVVDGGDVMMMMMTKGVYFSSRFFW